MQVMSHFDRCVVIGMLLLTLLARKEGVVTQLQQNLGRGFFNISVLLLLLLFQEGKTNDESKLGFF